MVDYNDLFKPYSPEIRGDLEEYLRTHSGRAADNYFFGPKYFYIIKEKGFMIPTVTFVRVNQSPVPDIGYTLNSDFLLESCGEGELNMSLVGAKKGIYTPEQALKDRGWSIHYLNLSC